MPGLDEIVQYVHKRLNVENVKDFKGAENGLQVGNSGKVTKIGAIVDAGLVPFNEAAARGVDLLICHHGLFWTPPLPIVGVAREKIKTLLDNDIALYSCHLPLDAHQELGNSAQIAQKLNLRIDHWGMEYEGVPMAPVCDFGKPIEELQLRLESLFPRVTRISFGSRKPARVCIVSGSGSQTLPELKTNGADTLITGELKQASFNVAQELGLNVFACGHYDTEIFGVRAVAEELSIRFNVPWEFIPTGCPL